MQLDQAQLDMERISGPACPTLPQLLKSRTESHPAGVALRQKRRGIWRRIAWRDYLEASEHCALGLLKIGVAKGDRVAILAENVPAWLYAEMAVLSLGGRVVALHPAMSKAAVVDILRRTEASALICGDQEQVDKMLESFAEGAALPALKSIVFVDPRGMRSYSNALLHEIGSVMALGKDAAAEARDELQTCRQTASADDIATILVEEGAGGSVELRPLTHRELLLSACGLVTALNLQNGPSTSVLSYLPLGSLIEQQVSPVLQLIIGSTINFGESEETVAGDLIEVAPTVFVGTADVWERLKNTIETRLDSARYLNRKLLRAALDRALQYTADSSGSDRSAPPRRRARPLVGRRLLRIVGLLRTETALCASGELSPKTRHFFLALGLPVLAHPDLAESGNPKLNHGSSGSAEPRGSASKPFELTIVAATQAKALANLGRLQ